MIVKTKLPCVPLTELLYRKASGRLLPLSGTFELTPVCNFACRMCYVRMTPGQVKCHSRPILTLEDWRRIAREAREQGMLYLLLTGGEPFLWPDFRTLYEELVDMGFLISINTNGSLIDADTIRWLRRRPPKRINITLYGASDATYERLCLARGVFDRVDQAIRGLKEAGINVKLNCSLTPHNEADLDRMLDYAEQNDVVIDVTSYMFPPIRRDESSVGTNESRFTPEQAAAYRLKVYRRQSGPENYQTLLQNILNGYVEPPGLDEGCVDPVDGRIRCRAGKASFWITWDGWMTPCGLMPEPRVDLMQTDFAAAWARLAQISGALRLSGVCDTCPNVRVCHPCAAMAVAETGSAAGIPQYLCRAVQEMRRIAGAELQSVRNTH